MIGLRVERLKLVVNTVNGEYGFECDFKLGLNIVRGNNSSGKSTLINALVYSIGMEEILGGKGEKVLPYALKNYVRSEGGSKEKIVSSYVYLQASNGKNDAVTLKRSIKSDDKNTKLIEVIAGRYLSEPDNRFCVHPKYLHDKGSAQDAESGFFAFLESFIGLNLPNVSSVRGGDVKLYIQTVFSLLVIEQKRGWTDYIANTPYYAIRDVRTKVVEFVLGLDVFENEQLNSTLLSQLNDVQLKWSEEFTKIGLVEENYSVEVQGVKRSVDEMFDPRLIKIVAHAEGVAYDLDDYIVELVRKVERINELTNKVREDVSVELLAEYENSKNRLERLMFVFDSTDTEIRLAKTRLTEYTSLLSSVEEDLAKNKVAKKLKEFGADNKLSLAHDSCPTCHQSVDDALFLVDSLVQPMTVDENIKYLDSQKNMISRYMIGLERMLSKLESQARQLTKDISDQRALSLSLKRQIRLSGEAGESDLRVKLQLELKIESLSKASSIVNNSLNELARVAEELREVKVKLAALSDKKSSARDQRKYKQFQEWFRTYAKLFDYNSAPVSDIEINRDTFLPYLAGLELREVNTDIKSDSSASDFVRLIWAYLLAAYSVSDELGGNHPRIIVLDEPGQHSMGVTSVNMLLKSISEKKNLQSIIAASFDESDEVFRESVCGVEYHLIECGLKLLKPVNQMH